MVHGNIQFNFPKNKFTNFSRAVLSGDKILLKRVVEIKGRGSGDKTARLRFFSTKYKYKYIKGRGT